MYGVRVKIGQQSRFKLAFILHGEGNIAAQQAKSNQALAVASLSCVNWMLDQLVPVGLAVWSSPDHFEYSQSSGRSYPANKRLLSAQVIERIQPRIPPG